MKNLKLEVIKLQLGLLASAIDSLSELMSYKIRSGKVNYRIKRTIDELHKEFELFQKTRVTLCELYSLKDSDGKHILIDNQHQFVIKNIKVDEGENPIEKYKISEESVANELKNIDLFNENWKELFETEYELKWFPIEVEWLDSNSDIVYTKNMIKLFDTFLIDTNAEEIAEEVQKEGE